jgi:hypothetical protein
MVVQFALIAEGEGDKPLVDILANLCRRVAGVDASGLWANDALALHGIGKNLPAQVQAVIKYHGNLDLLFIHRDDDSSDDSLARQHIDTSVREVASALRAVAVVPIQETEAWLLTDADAIRLVAGNPHGHDSLGLPAKVAHIESSARPKEILRGALVNAAKPGRQRQLISSNAKEFGRLRCRLLENLNLDGNVTQLRAWQRLLEDIKHALEPKSHIV